MGLDISNYIKVLGTPEEIKPVLEFMKSENSVLDIGKIMGAPAELLYTPPITEKMCVYFNSIHGPSIDVGAMFRLGLYDKHIEFTAEENKQMEQMLKNNNKYGDPRVIHWLWENYNVGTDGLDAELVNGEENHIKVWSRNSFAFEVFKKISNTFPTIMLDCYIWNGQHGESYSFHLLNGEYTFLSHLFDRPYEFETEIWKMRIPATYSHEDKGVAIKKLFCVYFNEDIAERDCYIADVESVNLIYNDSVQVIRLNHVIDHHESLMPAIPLSTFNKHPIEIRGENRL